MADAYLYPHVCTIKRRSATGVDAVGQPTWGSLTTVTAAQECMFADEGTMEIIRGYGVELAMPKLILPYGASIQDGDEISNISLSGSVIFAGPYTVTGTPRNPGGINDHLEAQLARVS